MCIMQMCCVCSLLNKLPIRRRCAYCVCAFVIMFRSMNFAIIDADGPGSYAFANRTETSPKQCTFVILHETDKRVHQPSLSLSRYAWFVSQLGAQKCFAYTFTCCDRMRACAGTLVARVCEAPVFIVINAYYCREMERWRLVG